MDRYSGKRGIAASRAPRKGHNVGSRDATSDQDQNVRFCNRIGCNGRIKYGNQDMRTGSSEKAKSSQSSFASLNGNGVIETSSRSGSVMAKGKSSHLDLKKKLSSRLGYDQSESSQSGNSEATQSTCSPGKSPPSYRSGSLNKSGQVPAAKARSVSSSFRARKGIPSTSGSNKENVLTTSAVSSTSTNHGKGTLQKNLKYNSTSDATPPSSSSSGSKTPSKHVKKKRSLEGDNSVYGRVRQATAAATFGGRVSSSSGGASTSDYRHRSCISRANVSVSPSVKTGGSANVNKSMMRLSYRQNARNTPCFRESSVHISQYPDSEAPTSDMLQQDGVDGFAAAIDRIDQYEGMRHETSGRAYSSYPSGRNLYDQHRDMRMDIDDLSYEELLALGDRMGTVSTALSEEELLKCLKRSIYQVTPPEEGLIELDEDGDDVKCCICQEEYTKGDEVGELVECQHVYHVGCVNQWLRLKNWCPICKSSAAPSQSSSSS